MLLGIIRNFFRIKYCGEGGFSTERINQEEESFKSEFSRQNVTWGRGKENLWHYLKNCQKLNKKKNDKFF